MAPIRSNCEISWDCDTCIQHKCRFAQFAISTYCVENLKSLSGEGYLVDSPEIPCPPPLPSFDDDVIEGANLALTIFFFLVSLVGILLLRKRIDLVLAALTLLTSNVSRSSNGETNLDSSEVASSPRARTQQNAKNKRTHITPRNPKPQFNFFNRNGPSKASQGFTSTPLSNFNRVTFHDSSSSFDATRATMLTDFSRSSTPSPSQNEASLPSSSSSTTITGTPEYLQTQLNADDLTSNRPNLPPPPPPRQKRKQGQQSSSSDLMPQSTSTSTSFNFSPQAYTPEQAEPIPTPKRSARIANLMQTGKIQELWKK